MDGFAGQKVSENHVQGSVWGTEGKKPTSETRTAAAAVSYILLYFINAYASNLYIYILYYVYTVLMKF